MNKILIVTGANRGLGKALVGISLKEKSIKVVSISRSLAPKHKGFSRNKFYYISKDLAEPFLDSEFDELKNIIKNEDHIYFINNAGTILPIARIGKLRSSEITNSVNVNSKFPILFINYLLSEFSENKVSLVNITSGAGENAISHWGLYCSSKASMKMLFEVLSLDYQSDPKYKFYNIDPGVLDTGMQQCIRNSRFPEQEIFKNLKKYDELIKPETAAKKILTQIEFYS